MKFSIGLPTAIPNTSASVFPIWARKAEQAGFASLGTIGRTVFDSHEELIALAGAAAVTEKIKLMTTVMIGPCRDSVLLAKQSATLDSLSNGRFCLGLGIGWRDDEYVAHGCPELFSCRGERLEVQVEVLRKIWAGEKLDSLEDSVGPKATPTLLLSGNVEAAVRRAGRLGDGFIGAPGDLKTTRQRFDWVKEEWQKAGRSGKPFLTASRYYALGDDVQQLADQNMTAYYTKAGPDFVEMMKGWVMRTPDDLKQAADEMREAGADELFFWPALSDPEQVDRLQAALPVPVTS